MSSSKPICTHRTCQRFKCFSHFLRDHDHALATSIHSPASELKTCLHFCTNTTALAPEHVRHGHSAQSTISATEIVTCGRRPRQIVRENSISKFSGQIHQRVSHSPKASTEANTMVQQGRENPFINPENCKLKKQKPHPEYQLLLFCLAMRFSASQTSKHLHSLGMAAIWNSKKKTSLTYFVQLLHKHGVRWTEKDVLKIVSIRQGAESSLKWKEGRSAGRLLQRSAGVGGEKCRKS